MIWVIIILLLFLFQIITILLSEYRHPSKTVAWLLVLFIVPILGFVMYYFLAKSYSRRKKVKDKSHRMMNELQRDLLQRSSIMQEDAMQNAVETHDNPRLFALLRNLPGSPITKCNETVVLTNAPETYQAMLKAMLEAKDHIHIEFYTIRHDRISRQFQAVMIQKAKEGVEVRLLYDGIGSYQLAESFVKELRDAGVQIGCFLPPFIALLDKRLNYRNHRKIVIIDGRIGFVGGINIGDEYLGANKRLGFWRDTHLQITGDAVYYLQRTFNKDWYFVNGIVLTEARFFPEHACAHNEQVQIVTSGPDTHWDTILEVYFAAITTAQKRVYISTPYFIPDPSVGMALKTAAISGIDVRVIFPAKADTVIVQWASLSYIEELLQAGVRFYQYKKGFMHAKVLLADDFFAFVGTANMDLRSFFSNFEINAVLFDKQTIQRLDQDFTEDLKNSDEIVLEQFQKRSRIQKGKELLARLLSPLF